MHLTDEEMEKILREMARADVEELERETLEHPVEVTEEEQESLRKKLRERFPQLFQENTGN